MTNPRKKGEVLSETTKSYLQEWTKEQIYGVRQVITSKYLTKGIEVEQDSINFAEKVLGWNLAVKNEDSYEDDFFTGTPDVIFPRDKVVDIKSSWDCGLPLANRMRAASAGISPNTASAVIHWPTYNKFQA